MSRLISKRIDELAFFNPSEKVVEGQTLKKIPMENLNIWSRKITGFVLGEYKSGSKFRNNDVLVAKITPCLENGKTAYVDILDENEVAFGSTEFIVLRPKEGIDSNFLYYLAISPTFRKRAISCMEGTSGRKRVNESTLKLYDILLPQEKQQKKIANVLLALDKKIELNNRINAELEAMAKTLYDYWFVQFDFPNEEGKPYKSSGGKMVYNTTLKREIPVMFSEGVLDNLGQIVGGSTPDTKDSDNFCIKGVPWITPNDLSNNQGNKYISKGEKNVSDKGIKSASLKKYPLGTVLLTSRAPIGYMAIARKEFTTNQGFKSFILNKGYPTDFVYYTIKNSLSIIIQFASGSTFKEISTTVLKTVPIVLPPLHIVKDFTNEIYSLTKKQNILEQECSELRNLRDWLLPMLMNGQVTVK
ncbi:hypothetical protein BGI03_04740 [Snodgrassella alvi]|uniref:restriction endonuclease subunit S n=1 Tax=Snodgrassella alvi TaxID=1196083 RepID=UPI0009FC5E8C|nr:restriction endonuclease subunit S [Snodgrassella alvi]ORF06329.1 hypothetical protein BGH98_06475 [Snodgrassella alvi]ORF14404.1 hypothetical protein BGI01_03985 [Snodgrassella alvi]ORF19230.1 hypothetical protein BGI03_04740 [Snodgrassella alvi]ORF19244.1 hypothetical protein BGI04_06685 [Snodgrassella alvi]